MPLTHTMRLLFCLLVIPGVFATHYHDRLHCPSTQEFMAELMQSEFKSPNFPNHYTNNLNCEYVIHPLENAGVALEIEHFEIESMHDTVEIYQTYNYNDELHSTKHAVLSGSDIPTNQFFSQINGGFYIVFKSDFSESRFSGFKMSFQRFYPTNTMGFNPCPDVFHMAQSENLELPLNGWRRSPRISCVFQINSTESVRLQLNSIKPNVKIDVYESENYKSTGRNSPLASYNAYSGTTFPAVIDSRSGSLLVLVNYMSTISDFTNAYNMSFHQVQHPCKCPPATIIVNSSETFYTSPGWPEEYCDSLNCVTRFRNRGYSQPKTDTYQCILLEIYDMELETIHDLLEFYDGSRKLKLMTPFDEYAPTRISYFTFPSTNAVVNFTTDGSITAKGFNLSVRLYDKPKKCRCPNEQQPNILTTKGQLNFQFPADCGYMDCFWNLMPPQNEDERHRIVLTAWFNIQSWSEFIEISNDDQMGPSLNTMRLLSPMSVTNGSGKVISMHSDQPVQIWYHREDEDPSLYPTARNIRIDYNWEQRCTCGPSELTATDKWTDLNSPDYPAPYCDMMNCTYVITAPEDSIILINVTQLDLEYNMDFLFFFDGRRTNESRIGAYTGIEFLDPVESSTNIVTIRFTSDVSMAGKGYQLTYRAMKPKQDYPSSSGFSVFKVFMVCAFVVAAAVGGIYVVKRYQPGLTLPTLSSIRVGRFDSQSLTSSLNAMLLRRNNNGEFVDTD